MGGTPDIGAYQAGICNSYETCIWETLPATATASAPQQAASRFAATPVRNGAFLEITAPGRTCTLLQSDTMQGGSWTTVPNPVPGTGSPHTFQVPIAAGSLFFQLRVSAP